MLSDKENVVKQCTVILRVWFGQSTPIFPCPWSINCSIDVGTACLGPLWGREPLIYDDLTKTHHTHFRTSIAFNRNFRKSMFQMSLFWSFQEWWDYWPPVWMWSMPVAKKKMSDGHTKRPGGVDFTKPFWAWWVSCHRPLCGQENLFGCFLKWWYPQNTPKWSFLVGKPMVVGYQHFRKPPLKCGVYFSFGSLVW